MALYDEDCGRKSATVLFLIPMKKKTKVLTLLLTIITGIFLYGGVAFAGGGQSNLNLTASSVQIQPGWTEYVSINNNPMTVSTLTGGFAFDPAMFQVTNIVTSNERLGIVSSVEEANANGTVGFAMIGLDDLHYDGGSLLTVELVAQKEGVTGFSLYEDSDGADGFKGDGIGTITTEITLSADGSAQGASAGVTDYVPGQAGANGGSNGGSEQGTGEQSAVGSSSGGTKETTAPGSSGTKSDGTKEKNASSGQKVIWPYAVGAGVALIGIIVLLIVIRRMKKSTGNRTEDKAGNTAEKDPEMSGENAENKTEEKKNENKKIEDGKTEIERETENK